jgi:hypothetical protein
VLLVHVDVERYPAVDAAPVLDDEPVITAPPDRHLRVPEQV